MKINPISVILFGSVIALIASILVFPYGDAAALIFMACACYTILGLVVGLQWPINPWRVGIIASIANMIFLIWRWFTATTAEDASLNVSLFIFLPIISLATSYLGAYIGRGIVIKRKIRDVQSKASK